MLEAVRAALPQVPDAPVRKPTELSVSLDDLYTGWKATAVVKLRTVTETHYVLKLLTDHLGHHDASTMIRDDLAAWRDAFKAAGLPNNGVALRRLGRYLEKVPVPQGLEKEE